MPMLSACKSVTPAKPEERQHHNSALQSLSSQRGRVQTDAPKSRATLSVRGFQTPEVSNPGFDTSAGLRFASAGLKKIFAANYGLREARIDLPARL